MHLAFRKSRRLAFVCIAISSGLTAQAQTLSNYGTPGLLEIPTAEMLPDGHLALTYGLLQDTQRATLTFQMLPYMHGTFRYAVIDDFDRGGALNRYDRSFDLHVQLREESADWPSLTLGLRDFGGTGIYASEYIVGTKHLGDDFKVTGGIGWGRLAGRNSFSNPLGFLNDGFKTRPSSGVGGISTTGQLDFGNWFRGDAALFGGVSWNVNDRLTLMAEYSPDLYPREEANIGFSVSSPLNFGAQYRFKNGAQLTGSYLYGTTYGLHYTYFIDPNKSVTPGGQGDSPPPLLPFDQIAVKSWNLGLDQAGDSHLTEAATARLSSELQLQGLRLVKAEIRGQIVNVQIENGLYNAPAQALGRSARVLANTLPARIETFNIALSKGGLPLSNVSIKRNDLYELEHDLDGAWRHLARAEVSDTLPLIEGTVVADKTSHLSYRLGPYAQASFFDPDSPLRYEVGIAAGVDYTPVSGLTFSTALKHPLEGNLDDTTRTSNSVIQRVRSDWALYAAQSETRIEHLTAEYIWRPGADLYARTTLGLLETMYGGASAELLWYPVNSRFALGAEVNYVKQRDFDVLFDFRDYEVATGHVSAYYDLPNEYHFQLDVGRYLAGDYGATFILDREFKNGFKVGAFFSLTTVSFDDFGEGSFDKGIKFEVPVSWFTGRPSRSKVGQVIRPVFRDGGARLNVRNRLYEYTRETRAVSLSKQWGRFSR